MTLLGGALRSGLLQRMALEYLDVYRSLIEFQALRSRVRVARASSN
jgi:hypothetical protein